jgi:hypothetical protein
MFGCVTEAAQGRVAAMASSAIRQERATTQAR